MPGVRAMVGSLLQYQYFVLFLFLLCFFAWNESNAGCLGKLNSALGFGFKSAVHAKVLVHRLNPNVHDIIMVIYTHNYENAHTLLFRKGLASELPLCVRCVCGGLSYNFGCQLSPAKSHREK